MILAFIIPVAGVWGALTALGIFGVVLWNAFASKVLKGRGMIVTTRRRIMMVNVAVSLVFNIVYFWVSLC